MKGVDAFGFIAALVVGLWLVVLVRDWFRHQH